MISSVEPLERHDQAEVMPQEKREVHIARAKELREKLHQTTLDIRMLREEERNETEAA